MRRRRIKAKEMTEAERLEILEQSRTRRIKRERAKFKFADSRGLLKVEGVEKSGEAAPFKLKLSEKQIAKALRICVGNQSQAGALLNISQSAVNQRIKKSRYLQEVVEGTRNVRLDGLENIFAKLEKRVLKALEEDNMTPEILEVVKLILPLGIKYLGWRRGWQKREGLEIDATVRPGGGILEMPHGLPREEWQAFVKKWDEEHGGGKGGYMLVPETLTPDEWEKQAQRHQRRLLGMEDDDGVIDVEVVEDEEQEEYEEMGEEEEQALDEKAEDFATHFDPDVPPKELSEAAQRRKIHESRVEEMGGNDPDMQGF